MKLLTILLEQEKILVPRRSKEERAKNYQIAINKEIQQYIENGSKGDLYLDGTPITSLPDILKYVGGDLNLYQSKIKSLPDNLKVEEHLVLANTPIEYLPDNLKVKGSILLTRSAIKSLPDNFKVGRSLYLENTSIEDLPYNLEVGEDFWIRNSPIADKYSDEGIKTLANIKGIIVR